MSIRSSVAIALTLTALAGAARGDGIENPTTQFVGNMGEGVSNFSSGAAPPPACTQGSLDFSGDCNTIFAVTVL